MKRCAVAVKALNATAETDITKLSAEDRHSVRVAFGEKEQPYEGCMSEECVDAAPNWLTETIGDLQCTRCARCGQLKDFVRKYAEFTQSMYAYEWDRIRFQLNQNA